LPTLAPAAKGRSGAALLLDPPLWCLGDLTSLKRLRGLSRPQYHLLIGEMRVFYDVVENEVEVLAIVAKSEAEEWLARVGER